MVGNYPGCRGALTVETSDVREVDSRIPPRRGDDGSWDIEGFESGA